MEHRIKDDENDQHRYRHDNRQPPLRTLLTLILAFPTDLVSRRQLHLLVHLPDGLLHRAAQVASPHAVFDGHVPRVAFPVDLRMIYAWLLRTNGVPRHEAAVEVNLMGSECNPRLTPSACRGAVKTGFGRRMARMRDQTISDRLDVTPSEAAMLERLPPATRFKQTDPAPPAPTPSEIH